MVTFEKKDGKPTIKKGSKTSKKSKKKTYKVADIATRLNSSKSYVYRKIKELNIELPKEFSRELYEDALERIDLQNCTPKKVTKSELNLSIFEESEPKVNQNQFTKNDGVEAIDLITELEKDYVELRRILFESVEMSKSVDVNQHGLKMYLKIRDEVRKNQQAINALVKTIYSIKFKDKEDLPSFQDELGDYFNGGN